MKNKVSTNGFDGGEQWCWINENELEVTAEKWDSTVKVTANKFIFSLLLGFMDDMVKVAEKGAENGRTVSAKIHLEECCLLYV